MTTIAYRRGVIAADGFAVEGNAIVARRVAKIGRLGKLLFGAAGELAFCWAFRSWIREGARGEPPVADNGSSGLIVLPDGWLFTVATPGLELTRSPFHAIGSGATFAMGAMQVGATAEQAVRAAAALDVYTGGRVLVLAR